MEVQRIYEAMAEAIVSGEMVPGARLSEPELARRFGTSRGPLREAIRRLQGRELLQWTPNSGARVYLATPAEVVEVYEVREMLEGCAARLAAIHMSDADIAELGSLLDEEDRLPSQAPHVKRSLHRFIAKGSGNGRLCRLLNDDYYALLRMWANQYEWLGYGSGHSHSEHRSIFDAIARHDPEVAEILMRRHVRRLRLATIENLRALGIWPDGKP
jgi:DNA-binding GntR family transcriptional regulator